MLLVGMLLLLIQMPNAWGFTHIKLAPQFAQNLAGPLVIDHNKSLSRNRLSLPVDGEISPIYQAVENYLQDQYQSIAQRQITDLTIINGELRFGLSNFLGYSWQQAFSGFSVNADRQVTQNLFADNWIVQDSFTFKIEATKLLEEMKDGGKLIMSDSEISAFAGISLHRTYTYYHYAPSYEDGLRADFTKLFFPYRYFNAQKIKSLGHEEIVRRHDTWKARAGGLIKTPPLYNIGFSAGVLTTLAFEKMVSLQKVIDKDINYQLNHKSEKKIDLGATLSFQLDFFKLLSLTLLRYDLNYKYEKAQAFTLAFSENDYTQFDTAKRTELSQIIRGSDEVNDLNPYIHRLDQSTKTSLSQIGTVLLWGGLKKSQTEQIKVIKDDVVYDFYKHYSQSVKLVQNFWSRIFSAVVYKIFRLPFSASNQSLLSKQVSLEFRANHPQSALPQIHRILTLEDFSFVIKKNYQANKTHGFWDQAKKNQAIYFVDNFTSLPKDYKTFLRSDELRGPLSFESQLRVESQGLNYFLTQAESNIFFVISKVCHSEMIYKWIDDAYREELLKKTHTGNESCVKRIGMKYLEFKNDFHDSRSSPSIALFKSFILEFYKKSSKLEELMVLFGSDNTFVHGSISATTSLGQPFITTFSAGQFQGLGVIDNFQRSTGSRQPASIISE